MRWGIRITLVILAFLASLWLISLLPNTPEEQARKQMRKAEIRADVDLLLKTGSAAVAAGYAEKFQMSGNSSLDLYIGTRSTDKAASLSELFCRRLFEQERALKSERWKVRIYLVDGSVGAECAIRASASQEALMNQPAAGRCSIAGDNLESCKWAEGGIVIDRLEGLAGSGNPRFIWRLELQIPLTYAENRASVQFGTMLSKISWVAPDTTDFERTRLVGELLARALKNDRSEITLGKYNWVGEIYGRDLWLIANLRQS